MIWPYRPALYVNLCTLNHDNSSCTYRDRVSGTRLPRPVMACRSSWYRDTDIGSVIGYSAKDDVRSGLFVELLHGEKCYGGKWDRWVKVGFHQFLVLRMNGASCCISGWSIQWNFCVVY